MLIIVYFIFPRCDVPCPKGTYGYACLKECNCSEDGRNSTCHHISGECLFPETTVMTYLSTTTTTQVTQKSEDNMRTDQHNSEITTKDYSSTVIRTSVTNSDETTVLPTISSLTTTQNIPLPITEKHVLYINVFTTAPLYNITEMTTAVTKPVITTTRAAATMTTTAVATTTAATMTTTKMMTTNTVTEPTDVAEFTTEGTVSSFEKEFANYPIIKPKEDSNDSESDPINSFNNQDKTNEKESDQRKEEEEEVSTEPQNIQIPPRGIIVVSDGLMSDRRDEEESVNESKNSRDSMLDLVSSVSVAGGVAFALIVMAAITLLVSHLRNKKKVTISDNKTSATDQQSSVPGPQMYNYTEDVTTLPCKYIYET